MRVLLFLAVGHHPLGAVGRLGGRHLGVCLELNGRWKKKGERGQRRRAGDGVGVLSGVLLEISPSPEGEALGENSPLGDSVFNQETVFPGEFDQSSLPGDLLVPWGGQPR